MVHRTIRDPPPLAGQRRFSVIAFGVTFFVAYLATFWTSWLHAYNDESLIGKVMCRLYDALPLLLIMDPMILL